MRSGRSHSRAVRLAIGVGALALLPGHGHAWTGGLSPERVLEERASLRFDAAGPLSGPVEWTPLLVEAPEPGALTLDLSRERPRAPQDELPDPLATSEAFERRSRGEAPLGDWRVEFQRLGAEAGSGGAILEAPAAEGAHAARLDLLDVALAWDAKPAPDNIPLTFSALLGLSAVRYGAERDAQRTLPDGSLVFDRVEAGGIGAAPLAGVRARWELPGGLYVSSGSSWRIAPGLDPRDFSLTADLGYAVTRRLGVSIGYERTRVGHSDEDFVASLKSDLVFARVSLSF